MVISSASERKLKDLKFVVATRMLDHIGVSMYSKPEKAISELVVNGYDADANYLEVKIGHGRVVISDNGSGMGEADIREAYMFLGTGQKRLTKQTPIFGRLPIGNKGIGKLAGLGVAKRMEVRTVKGGKGYRFCIDRDELDNSERMGRLSEAVLDRATMGLTQFKPRSGEASGTTVTLTRIRKECGRIEPRRVMAHIARELPLGPTFKVVVNKHVCKPTDIDAKKRIPVDYVDPICSPIKGEIIVARKRLPNAGISTRVRGRVVGEPSFFGINTASLRYNVGDLITGLVEVTSFDAEDGADEVPVIKTDREGFVQSHPKYVAYSEYMTRVLTSVCRELEKEHEERRDAEKRAKVDQAIRQVAADLAAFDKLRRPPLATGAQLRGQRDRTGDDLAHPRVEVDGNGRSGRQGPKRKLPPDTWEQIWATLGSGRLRFGNATYDVKPVPLGEDFDECEVCRSEALILVNVDHPSYEQAVEEKCTEIVVFRAVAERLAAEEAHTAAEMCDTLDEMVRFHAERMKLRRARRELREPS